MRQVGIYIGSERLDLFGDEDINLIKKASDYRDIGRVYTDFTQTFTVPASPNNNRILKHYYDLHVSSGYTQSQAIDGHIEVDTLPVRAGTFTIEGAKLKNGLPSSYSLSFYGALKGLKDLFAEDKLESLDLSAYDHAYSFANVLQGVEASSGLFGGDVYYPLISPVRLWSYDSNSANHDSINIAYHTGHSSNEHGIYSYELKPCLRVAAIVDAIEADYGLTFNSSFLATDAFQKVYMWLHRTEGYMPAIGQDITVACTATIEHDWDDTEKTITFVYGCTFGLYSVSYLSGTTAGTNFIIEVYLNGELKILTSTGLAPYLGSFTVVTGDVVSFKFRTLNLDVTANLRASIIFTDGVYVSGGGFQTIDFNIAQSIVYSYADISRIIPDMKVYDFLTGIFKMFNLIIYPTSTGYTIEPYDDWYAAGTTRDISRFSDTASIDLNKPQVYREINFQYEEPGTINAKTYGEAFGQNFGDLELELDFADASDFTVQAPFEMLVWDRLFDSDDDTPTNILYAASVSDSTTEPKPYIGKPMLMYYAGWQSGLTKSFNLLTAAGADNEVEDYNTFSSANETALTGNTLSLCFGADIDPYFGSVVTRGLYAEYYQDQITDIYNSRTREVMLETVLDLATIINIEMNDVIVFNGTRFRIDTMDINLNTGRVKFKLINIV